MVAKVQNKTQEAAIKARLAQFDKGTEVELSKFYKDLFQYFDSSKDSLRYIGEGVVQRWMVSRESEREELLARLQSSVPDVPAPDATKVTRALEKRKAKCDSYTPQDAQGIPIKQGKEIKKRKRSSRNQYASQCSSSTDMISPPASDDEYQGE